MTPTLVVAIVGGVAGLVALTTALINRRTAVIGRDKQRAELAAVDAATAASPSVLLPARMPSFVDRREVLADASEHLRRGQQLLAIEGDVGVGKSAVATELLHRLRESDAADVGLAGHAFVWVDGRGGAPSIGEICAQVALTSDDQALTTVADAVKLDALRAHLARERTVLLLDNVVAPVDHRGDDLRSLLSTLPSGSVVVTALNGDDGLAGAARVHVEELHPDHVRELIEHETRRIGIADPAVFGEAFARRLHAVVGGNPALIAAFLRSVPGSPEPLDDLLEAVARGRGMMQLFVPVWDQLSDDGQAVLTVCSMLRGRAVKEQLVAASGIDGARVSTALSELVRSGVLQVVRVADGPERFICGVGVQRFVRDRADSTLIRVFASRLSAHFVRVLADRPEDASWAAAHVDAFGAVLGELFDLQEDVEVQALFASVLDVLFTLGRFDDRIALGQVAFQSAERSGNDRAASLACDVLASTHAARGEIERAMDAVAHGALAAERAADDGERARQRRVHGVVLYKDGQAQAAEEILDGVDALARASGDLEVVVNVHGIRTVVLMALDRKDDAESAARAGLETCDEMGWRRARAYPLRNLAELALRRGQLNEATALADEARKVATEFGDRRQLVRVDLTAARLALARRDPHGAVLGARRVTAEAKGLGLQPEAREADALGKLATRVRRLPFAAGRWTRDGRPYLTEAPIGGD